MPPTLRGKVILAITLHFFVALRRTLPYCVAALRKPGPENPMNPSTIQSLRAAISESIASRNVPTLSVPDIESAIRFIRSRFVDVDYDPHPDRVTVFGDDPSIPVAEDGDGDEGHFVIDLVFPVTSSNPFNE